MGVSTFNMKSLDMNHFQQVNFTDQNYDLHSNIPGTFLACVIGVLNFCILVLGFLVHRAVYKLLNRLPNRYINQIIYPYTVSIYIYVIK